MWTNRDQVRCIGCKIPICNVCSVSCSTETPGYCEESYLVGNCEACQGNSRKRKISDLSTAQKPRQSSLSTFFNVKTKPPAKPSLETPRSKPQDTFSQEKLPSTSTSTPPSTKKPRRLSVTAANGWKATALATHLASEWLVINADKNKSDCVMSLNCSVCKAHADKINGMKNFSTAWAFTGSTNLRLSNAEDHARGEPHKRALDLHLKETKRQHAFERAESMKTANDSGQQLITTGIVNMQSTDLARTKTKFEVAYFVAKEELPLSKYPQLLNLEEKHGVDLGNAYRSDKSCNMFIAHIGEELARKLGEKLSTANFFSVLTDGFEDASITEKEAIFVHIQNI